MVTGEKNIVAPHVGAWIETDLEPDSNQLGRSRPTWARGLKQNGVADDWRTKVAPHVGAWIETRDAVGLNELVNVAPHVGAWIETPLVA